MRADAARNRQHLAGQQVHLLRTVEGDDGDVAVEALFAERVRPEQIGLDAHEVPVAAGEVHVDVEAGVVPHQQRRGQRSDAQAGRPSHLTLRRGGGREPDLQPEQAQARRCGQRGCLETVAGGAYLSRRLDSLGLRLPDLGSDLRPAAVTERERLVAAVATTLTLVVISYDSDLVALGGGVLRAASWLREQVATELERRAATSPFLAGLAIADRLVELPTGLPVAAFGAAVVGRKKELRAKPAAATEAKD